jgi:hypothetical protein
VRATYFTVTWELLRELGITNLETDNLDGLFQFPTDVHVFNVGQDWFDWQMNCFKVALTGEGLPAWAEKQEGELMKPCESKITRLEDGTLLWQFREDTQHCPQCGKSR